MNALRSAIIGQVVLIGSALSLFSQGTLAPPGPPAPIMKTLQQVEPRVPIESLPYTIGTPGSYYLTDNLSGSAGIVIKADNVTIDLRGFALLGTGSASGGIEVVANVSGLSVYNGTISGWNGNGIEASMASDSQFSKLRLSSNTGSGVTAGKGCSISDCVVASNGRPGIEVDSSCYVNGNTCRANSGSGIHVLGTVNRIDSNHLTDQTGNGIKVDGSRNLIIRNSACNNSLADYAIGAGNDYGQILYTPGANFTSTVTWANFGCSNAVAGCTTDSQCNDNNPCTSDTCNVMNGTCQNTFVPNGTICPNGTCQNGTCSPQTCMSSAECNDNDSCTTDSCQMNTCVHTPIPNCNGACSSDVDCAYLTSGCSVGVCSSGVCGTMQRPNG